VSHVFNFDVPTHAEDYVHRIGRTGRAGREGKALTICGPKDEKYLADIETLIQKEIPRLDLPEATPGPAKSAETAAPGSDQKPKRSRGGRGRKKPEPREAARAAETAEAPETPKTEPAPKPARSRKSGGKDKDSAGGAKVVGMGDHLPRFIALSLEERLAG
jgi:ATP-dependent RNA helicase RhlE